MKVIFLAILTIANIHEISSHNHWKPSEDCLNGVEEAWKCCLAARTTIYLKNPKYCNTYFKCSHRHLELKSCHLGSHWSVEHQDCKNPVEAQCENISETVTITTQISTSIPKDYKTKLPEGCYDGSISVNECCKVAQTWFVLIPDPNNCQKFYKCYGGKSFHHRCPYHFKWNTKKRMCTFFSNNKCPDPEPTTSKPTTTVKSTNLLSPTTTTSSPWQLPNGCYDGSNKATECCKIDMDKVTKDISIVSLIGQNFDLEDFTRHTHSGSRSGEERNFNNETLADPKDCHKYFQCKKGKPVHMSCRNHYKWNIELRKCIYSESNKCSDPEPTTSKPTTTEALTSKNPTTTDKSTEATTLTPTTTTASPWQLPDSCYDGTIKATECCKIDMGKATKDISIVSLIGENFDLEDLTRHTHSGSGSGEERNFNNETLADPKDCHKYFLCKKGKPIHTSCRNHYKWNIELRECVYSDSNKCSDPEPTTSKPTTTEVITSRSPTSTDKSTEATSLAPTTTTSSPWQLSDGCYVGSIKATECCKIDTDIATKDISIGSLIGENFDLEDLTRHTHSGSRSGEENNYNNETLADPKDCHKYFLCKKGKPVHTSCRNHYKWSIELRKCIYSESNKCSDPEPTTSKPTTTEAITSKNPTTTDKSTEATTLTPTTTTASPWQLPDSCYDGTIKATECCKIDMGKATKDISIVSLIGENFDLEDLTRHTHSGSGSGEERNFNNETLADPKDCHKYFLCKKGKPIHTSCRNHYKWNIELRECVYSDSNKCSDPEPTTSKPTTTEVITSRSPTSTDKSTEATSLAPTTTTSSPWQLSDGCYVGSIKATECCKIDTDIATKDISIGSLIGENFDLEDLTRHTHSGSRSGEENNYNNETLADPKDCHKYFLCKKGKPVHKSCRNHYKWSIELRKCIYSESNKCSDPEPTTSKPTTTEAITSNSPTTTDKSTEATSLAPTATTSSPWQLPDGCYVGSIKATECCKIDIGKVTKDISIVSLMGENFDLGDFTRHTHSGSGSGEERSFNNETLADPKDCHKYFQCKKGKPVHRSCPKHYKWSIEIRKCIYSENDKCSYPKPTTTIPTTTSINGDITASTTEEVATTTEQTTTTIISLTTTSESTTPTTGAATTTEWAQSTTTEDASTVEATTTTMTTTEPSETTITTTEMAITTEESTTKSTEMPTTTERTTTTTEIETTSTGPTTTSTEAATTTDPTTTSELASPTTEATTTTEIETTSTGPTTTSTEAATTTDPTTTSELASPTTEATTTSEIETTSTEPTTTSTEAATTTDPTTTSELASPTTEATTTSEIETTSTEPTTTSTEAGTTTEPTTEKITTTEAITTTEDTLTTTTEKPTTPKDTSTEPITTSESPTTTSTEAVVTTTEEIQTTTEAATTTKETPTTEVITTEQITTYKPTTEGTVSTTVQTTSSEVFTSTTGETVTTEFPHNSTTEENTDPTADPNGSCGTASYKCRHGIISAEECCKDVPYWEDRLLQNNDNCGTYFQCVHEVPQVRICPQGLYWSADVCRCEWKELSTCNF